MTDHLGCMDSGTENSVGLLLALLLGILLADLLGSLLGRTVVEADLVFGTEEVNSPLECWSSWPHHLD